MDGATRRFSSKQLAAVSRQLFTESLHCCQLPPARCLLQIAASPYIPVSVSFRGGLCLKCIASVGFHNVRVCDAKSGLDWWNSFGEEHGV